MTVQTWSPPYNVNWAYTSGNLAAADNDGSNYSTVRGLFSRNAPVKIYWETIPTAFSSGASYAIGICSISHTATAEYLGSTVHSVGWFPSDGIWRNGAEIDVSTYSLGDNIAQQLDLVAKTLSFQKNGGSLIGPFDVSLVINDDTDGAVFPAAQGKANGDAATAHFTRASWAFSAPAGYVAWDEIYDPTQMMFLLSP